MECAGCSGSGRVHSVRGRSCSSSCWLRWLPWPQPQAPPYHLCLSHLKGWLLAPLLSPFVLLTNVAALQGEICKVSLHSLKVYKQNLQSYVYHLLLPWYQHMTCTDDPLQVYCSREETNVRLDKYHRFDCTETIGWEHNWKWIEQKMKLLSSVELPLK